MKKRKKPSVAGRRLTWSIHESLSLNSEKIEEFLAQRTLNREEEYTKAIDFFRKIRVMMDDSNWVITTQRAEFRALNRTGGTIRSIHATVDFFADDRLFHTADITRTLIEANDQFEIGEDILQKVYEVAGVIRDEYGEPLRLKNTPELTCGFREYDVTISDSHRMFSNEYVCGVAGIIPMKKNSSEYEEFVRCAGELSGKLKQEADRITENINRLIEISADSAEKRIRVEGFMSRYLPTLSRAISIYSARPEKNKAEELLHTMNVVAISTNNLYRSVSGDEEDISSIEQNILEQQLIREGLYSPFDNYSK